MFFLYFSGNATRQCSIDGLWEEKGHYDDCIPVQLPPDGPGPCENSTIPLCNDYSMLIYSIGYSLSLITLLMALIIFISFRYKILFSKIVMFFLSRGIGFKGKCLAC